MDEKMSYILYSPIKDNFPWIYYGLRFYSLEYGICSTDKKKKGICSNSSHEKWV